MRAVAKAGGWVWQMFAGTQSMLAFTFVQLCMWFSRLSVVAVGLSAPPDKGPECVSGYHTACARLRTDMNLMGLRLKDSNEPGSVLDAASDVAR